MTFRLPRYLGVSHQPREVQDTLNGAIDALRRIPQMEVLDLVVDSLSVPIELQTKTVVSPVYVGVNAWEAGQEQIAAGLTEFSWQATAPRVFTVHTLDGLTAGLNYHLVFFVVGLGSDAGR